MGSEENSAEEYSGEIVEMPAFALVIGISKYLHSQEPNQELLPENFTRLKYAAKDASDFTSFLRDKGFYDWNVECLLDENATRENIINELYQLTIKCAKSDPNPLVVVYYSGHGWPSPEGKYNCLIPHDARRDKLIGTAITNDEFGRWLSEVPTNRLVVFVDACHSGDIGVEGGKGTAPSYSHAGLGEGAGRYMIASCSANEQSYEDVGNGIFTKNLLLLLRGETDDIKEEEIKTTNLIEPLSKRVQQAAFERYQKTQTLTQTIDQGQGIVLAINKRVRNLRRQKEAQTRTSELAFLELVRAGIDRTDNIDKQTMKAVLNRHVKSRQHETKYDDLCDLFNESLRNWLTDTSAPMDLPVSYLVDTFDICKVQKAQTPKKVEDSYKASDKFVQPVDTNVLPSDKLTTPRAIAQPSSAEELRQVSTADRDHILKELLEELDYYQDVSPFIDILSRPVAPGMFSRLVHAARQKRPDDKTFSKFLGLAVDRFQECWPRSPEVASATVSDLRFR